MGYEDNGKQIVTFDFRQDATSINFNKYGTNLIRQGLYKGGKVTFNYNSNTDSYFYSIDPFTCAFLVTEQVTTIVNKLLVNVSSTDTSTINSIAPSNLGSLVLELLSPGNNNSMYIVLEFNWAKTLNNYINFLKKNSISSLTSNQIVLCKVTGQGIGKKPLITYDETTYGSYYEGYDQKYIIPTDTATSTGGQEYSGTNRKLIPYSSDSYLLKLTPYSSVTNSDNNSYITFSPIDGEIELIDITDSNLKNQKVKIVFDTNGNLDVSYSAKMSVRIATLYVSNFLCISLTNGRLKIQNGYSTERTYIIKSNIFNKGRFLNTSSSLD